MKKQDIIKHIAASKGMTQTDVKKALDGLEELATAQVQKGEELGLGFVTITTAERSARTGRNPATGDPVEIPAKKTIKARFPKSMKDAANAAA